MHVLFNVNVPHIVRYIFEQLDPQDLLSCILVNHQWHDFIKTNIKLCPEKKCQLHARASTRRWLDPNRDVEIIGVNLESLSVPGVYVTIKDKGKELRKVYVLRDVPHVLRLPVHEGTALLKDDTISIGRRFITMPSARDVWVSRTFTVYCIDTGKWITDKNCPLYDPNTYVFTSKR